MIAKETDIDLIGIYCILLIRLLIMKAKMHTLLSLVFIKTLSAFDYPH